MPSANWRAARGRPAEPAGSPAGPRAVRACLSRGGLRSGRRSPGLVRDSARFGAIRRRRRPRPPHRRGSDSRIPDSAGQSAGHRRVRLRRGRSRKRGARYRAAPGFRPCGHSGARRPRPPRGTWCGRHGPGGDRSRAGPGRPQPLGDRRRSSRPACHHWAGEFVKRQEGPILWKRSVYGFGVRCGVGCRDDGGGGTP